MGKLNDTTEALLLQAIADATANLRPCPPLTLSTAGKFAIQGWVLPETRGRFFQYGIAIAVAGLLFTALKKSTFSNMIPAAFFTSFLCDAGAL